MRYVNVSDGTFISRPNRFIAHVKIEGRDQVCHVKNTGRLKELFIPGKTVYCSHSDANGRKTEWDVIAVDRGDILFNVDSQAPNKVFAEFVQKGGFYGACDKVCPEYKYGNSRFDFMLSRSGKTEFVEIKGVTLENGGKLLFPDAPTERGVKHIRELIRAKSEGFGASVVFVLQMRGASAFGSNDAAQPELGAALREARACGVGVYAYDCDVSPDFISIRSRVKVML